MQPLPYHSRKACDNVLRKGRVWKGQTMMIHWMPGVPRSAKSRVILSLSKDEPRHVYLGTFASTSLHKSAVKRNRMRRRCREAFRLSLKNRSNLPSVQLLIRPRIASLTVPFEEIQTDVKRFLSIL